MSSRNEAFAAAAALSRTVYGRTSWGESDKRLILATVAELADRVAASDPEFWERVKQRIGAEP